MSATSRAALTRELQRVRDVSLGPSIRGIATFKCPAETCPVGLIRVGFVEEHGITKPFQTPCRCVRCSTELEYVGLERRV
jgi:hypothetical protein